MKKYFYVGLVFLIATVASFQLFVKPWLGPTDSIYKQVAVDESKLARMPVDKLVTCLLNENWQLIDGLFSDTLALHNFKADLGIGSPQGTMKDKFVSYQITNIKSHQKKGTKGDYTINLELSFNGNTDETTTLACHLNFDRAGKEYLIDQVVFESSALTKQNETLPNGRVSVPKISESPCKSDITAGFSLIQLKHRVDKSSDIIPNVVLNNISDRHNEQVPEDFYQTSAIKQISFPVIEEKKYSYDPGLVISAKDSEANKLGRLFAKLWDGDGVLNFTDQNGNITNYPTAFFIDRRPRRLVAMSRNNDYIVYGNAYNHHQFSDPRAVCVIGNYIYVLDRGEKNEVVIFKASVSDKLHLELVGATDFGLDMLGTGDITGFTTDKNNYLFVSSLRHDRLYRIILDPATGLAKSGNAPQELETYIHHDGRPREFGYINRMEVHPIGNDGRCVLFGIQFNTEAYAFYIDGQSEDTEIRLNYHYRFPDASVLTNVGYNLGNNSFNVTDAHAGKIHIFSAQGAYLGSGGSFGRSEGNEELYYANLISSNGFANDAIEMLVASEWGEDTGFKRLLPQGDIGNIEVIEKAPSSRANIANQSLLFRYALTSGYQVDRVRLKLNGQLLKSITQGLFPDIHSEEFLVNQEDEQGLKGKLKAGWNSYEVELSGQIPGPSTASLQYKRTKRMEFFYTPSVLTTASLSGKDGMPHSVTEPLVLYKSTFVDGNEFVLKGGKIVLMEGSILDIAEHTTTNIENEIFEFHCGANLALRIQPGTAKTIKNSYFDGLNKNYNMISCYGSYTGGQGSGSAPSSELEIIESAFTNYLGKALYVKEGRATVVNSSFTSTLFENRPQPFLTAAGIMMAPKTRLDVRGGEFIDNDIAIDANHASLYIGHSSESYKGVSTGSPQFKDNQIAIHAYETFSDIKQSIFDSNTAAIIQLSGELDISKNSQNVFSKNVQAIIFSDVARGAQGKNQFIDNNVDLTYILPQEGATEVSYDFSCNYWVHGETSGVPVIDRLGEGAQKTITVTTTPHLAKRGNGFTCTGGTSSKGGRVAFSSEEERFEDSTYQHPYHRQLSEIQEIFTVSEADAYQQIASMRPAELAFNTYTNRKDTSSVYHQAVVKNAVLDYLYRAEDHADIDQETYTEAFEILTSYYSPDNYIDISQDKLKFLSYFDKEARKVAPRADNFPVYQTVQHLLVYPNPVDDQTTIEIQLPTEGNYSLAILNNQGAIVRQIVSATFYAEGTHTLPVNLSTLATSIYHVNLYQQWGTLLDTYRIVKK